MNDATAALRRAVASGVSIGELLSVPGARGPALPPNPSVLDCDDAVRLWIIRLRERMWMSQTELGRAIGRGRRAISAAETGASRPSVQTFRRLLQLELDLDSGAARWKPATPLCGGPACDPIDTPRRPA